ncbi:hypothetical protein, partial [Kosakonia cowanii]|uniref:hypothetical protein n=1 Tax=Kosakonia cowanii TaxID=208223 RepID=UPI001F5808B4
QHRFPRGAAGIDKGSAAASLVPFTAYEVNETSLRMVNGILPPVQYAETIAGWRLRLIRPTEPLPPRQRAAPIAGWRWRLSGLQGSSCSSGYASQMQHSKPLFNRWLLLI